MKKLIFVLSCLVFFSCNQPGETIKPYVIEVTTFKYKESVNPDDFWKEDVKIQTNYTGKQPGFISRESGYSNQSNEVLIMVKWKTKADAEASIKKFMADKSVVEYVEMIDGSTMNIRRYSVE